MRQLHSNWDYKYFQSLTPNAKSNVPLNKKALWTIIILFLPISFSSCSKFIDVDLPTTNTTVQSAFKGDASAIATLNGIYTMMSQQGIDGGITSMSLYPGLSADELTVVNGADDPTLTSYYTNSLSSSAYLGPNYWSTIYSSYIFSINSAIQGLSNANELTPQIRNQLWGEALFLRAFCYFYLVNLYGDVPLVLTTEYDINSSLGRTSKEVIYKQIIEDLKAAKINLNENYLDGTLLHPSNERVAPNKWVASSLLARVYLYLSEWQNAKDETDSVISNADLYDMVDIKDAYLINNKEAIWQIQGVGNIVTNTSEARYFILPADGPSKFSNKVYLNPSLVTDFEMGDKRKENWIGSVTAGGVTYYYPFKYKVKDFFAPVQERTVVFRLAELYLIRAEANVMLNNFDKSIDDLTVVRKRAGLQTSVPLEKEKILNAILRERRFELFTEWGHRWFDLKRLGKINEVLMAVKGINWQSTDQLYPIPLDDIIKDVNLKGQQNPGY